jgi:hypothetical protein
MIRYLLGFIATIGLVILVIFLIFHGGPKTSVSTTSKPLDSYANSNTDVSMTIDGPINDNQDHQQIKVTVSQNQTTFQQIQGYQGNVVKSQTYSNNADAYSSFLHALERAGFTEGDTSSALKNDLGYCPLGDRYIFVLNQNSNNLERYWATNCGGTSSYRGDLGLTLTLFENQVPNYSDLTENIEL